MDWSKTKNILIIALIATNIFLLVTYMAKNERETTIAEMDVLTSILEDRNVFFEAEIPAYERKVPAITLSYSDESKKIADILREQEYMLVNGAMSGDVAHNDMATQFLKDCGLFSEALEFDKVIRDEDGVTIARFKNLYKEMAIGGSYIDVTFKDGVIVNSSNKFVTVASKSKKKLEIISPEEALLVLMSEKVQEDVLKIKGIELVYWINDSSFESEGLISDTAFPAWEITYSDDSIDYIGAYRE